jgi:oligoribonuclease NrnB/cAMP/cGMP phosphodiesterase (DHH superfamily)
MHYIDVFNGDADGICALIQLRKANPQQAQLITGVKRDINLLKHVEATPEHHISVLDISFDKNRPDIERLLKQGASIKYFDHHYCGALIYHSRLQTIIEDQSSTLCTGLIVDQYIGGKFRAWALVAAYGDNLIVPAQSLGKNSGFNHESLNMLQRLGMYINYNSYGSSLSDLFFHPDVLYRHLQQYDSPLDFMAEDSYIYNTLDAGYREDLAKAKASPYLYQSAMAAVVFFHNEKWARRVSGAYINELANQYPDRAHAVITENTDNTCTISIRRPVNRETLPADQLARQFASGGGRKSAAGINALHTDQVDQFIEAFKRHFSQ